MTYSKRKILKYFSSIIVLTTFSGLAISCSGSSEGFLYDSNVDNEVRLWSGFSASGPQQKSLEAIVQKYNETQKDKTGFLPVKVTRINNGYSGISDTLTQRLNSKSKDDLPNLVLQYPSLLAEVKRQRMNIDLGINLNERFDENFLQGNNVSALDNSKANIVPFGVSGVAKAINGPVVSYILEKAKEAGATVKSEDEDFVNTFILEDKSDYEFIKNGNKNKTYKDFEGGGFGEPSANSWNGFTITKDHLMTFSGLFQFGTKVFATFSGLQNAVNNINSSRAFLGIDSLANLVFQLLYSINDGKAEGNIFSVDKQGRIDYKALFEDKNSSQYRNFKKLYEDYLKPGLASGVLWIGDGGSYASNFFQKHGMAFSLSSTAGYNFNFVNVAKPSFQYQSKTNSDKSINENLVYNLKAKRDKQTNYYAQIQGPNSRYTNGLVKFNTAKNANNQITNLQNNKEQSYYVIPKDEATDKKLESLVNDAQFINGFLIAEDAKDFETIKKHFGDLVKVGTFYDSTNSKNKVNQDFLGKEVVLYFVAATNFTKVNVTAAKENATLQKEELKAGVLTHFDNQTPGYVYRQGPSLIGVHANDKGDQATRLFVEWVTNPENKFDFEINGKTYKDISPQVAFSLGASYLIPYKGFTTDPKIKDFIDNKANLFQRTSFQAFAQGADKNDPLKVFSENVDSLSQAFRKTLESVFFSARNSLTGSATFPDFDAFLTNFKRDFNN